MKNDYSGFLKEGQRKRLEAITITIAAGIAAKVTSVYQYENIAKDSIKIAKSLIIELDLENSGEQD